MARVRQFLDWYRHRRLSSQLVPVAMAGAGYAMAVIWYGHPGFNLPFVEIDPRAAKSLVFLSKGKSILWLLLVAAESALWFAVIAAYARPAPESAATTWRQWLGRWVPRVLGYAATAGAFCLPLLYSNLFAAKTASDYSPLLWHGPKMLWLAIPAVTAVVCVMARLRETEHAAARLASEDLPTRVVTFLAQQQRLRFALAVLGLMLSLNVFATGALRNALMYDIQKSPDGVWLFDMELVLAFGGAYTFFVMAFYAPVYFALNNAGEAIADDAVRPTTATAMTPADVLVRLNLRAQWAQALGLEQDWLKSLQAGLVLLSPFFAALASLLLPASK